MLRAAFLHKSDSTYVFLGPPVERGLAKRFNKLLTIRVPPGRPKHHVLGTGSSFAEAWKSAKSFSNDGQGSYGLSRSEILSLRCISATTRAGDSAITATTGYAWESLS
jgi:hypothetical protein